MVPEGAIDTEVLRSLWSSFRQLVADTAPKTESGIAASTEHPRLNLPALTDVHVPAGVNPVIVLRGNERDGTCDRANSFAGRPGELYRCLKFEPTVAGLA